LRVRKRKISSCVYIRLPNSWDEFLRERRKDLRYKIIKGRKRLLELGHYEFRTLRQNDDPEEIFQSWLEMRLLRSKTKGIDDSVQSEVFLRFHREVVSLFQKKGILWFSGLYLKGRPIAVLYNIQFGDRLFFYSTGMIQCGSNQIRPGLLIHSFCIEEAISNGIKEYDFLRGEEQYKFSWANTYRSLLEIKISKKNPKINAVWFLEDLKSKLRNYRRGTQAKGKDR